MDPYRTILAQVEDVLIQLRQLNRQGEHTRCRELSVAIQHVETGQLWLMKTQDEYSPSDDDKISAFVVRDSQ